jgi:uncharacterized tellurite resistance protein B-like protein
MASVRERIELLADIFMAAAYADRKFHVQERDYIREVLRDLLCSGTLPEAVAQHVDDFAPDRFDLLGAARDFTRDPPMSRRRLLELCTYVTLADGQQNIDEIAFLRALGEALGCAADEYEDLISDRLRLRHSFVDLARVPLPETPGA